MEPPNKSCVFTYEPLPHDPRRPPIPYVAGFETLLTAHTPPPPLGPYNTKRGEGREEASEDETEHFTHSEWCLRHPPEGALVVDNPSPKAMRLLEQLSCPCCAGPKVFRCVLGDSENKTFAAKIYDPLYYMFPGDVSYWADVDYSVEAGAYEVIRDAGLDGRYTPKYHGSWAMQVPFSAQITRTVCLVLMEDLKGVTMHTLLQKNLYIRIPPTQRLDILAEIFEIYRKLQFAGVLHQDLAPRNIILMNLNLNHYTPPRVVVFDFNIASILNRPTSKYPRVPGTRPMSPMYMYWISPPTNFGRWVPEPYCSQPATWRGWAYKRWYHSKEFGDIKEAREAFCRDLEVEWPIEFAEPLPDALSDEEDTPNYESGE
ncbi:hypothetical protein B0I35DRAFT_425755 [Stachybotrys elegans]|uniref:EKC/KEOPS complex subunit BUD32 n=1 Tax=Stachybotrys elegans TaxID=80388 RepID=A0A8K0SWI3_9HYPO|nr:hypothetical protein B0I35DRAFT_425755 [Stachybotrys elegans]